MKLGIVFVALRTVPVLTSITPALLMETPSNE